MSNAVAPTNLTAVPAHIAARIAARQGGQASSGIAQAIVSGDGFPYPKISIKAGRFRLVEDGVETPVGINLDVVIVGANPKVSKIFYAKPFDPAADGVRPDCFSNDGVRPDASVASPVHDNCTACPHNVLGSKITPTGAQSKLCADQRHLAVVPAADPTKVYAFTVTVSAMKALREYFKELQNFGVEPNEVVTLLGFDDKATFPKVTFARKGFVPEGAISKIDEIVNSDEVKEVVRVLPVSGRPALAAPAAVPSLAPPVDPAYDDAAPAPAAAATPAPAAKAAKSKPTPPAAPVTHSEELGAKLDSLFAE